MSLQPWAEFQNLNVWTLIKRPNFLGDSEFPESMNSFKIRWSSQFTVITVSWDSSRLTREQDSGVRCTSGVRRDFNILHSVRAKNQLYSWKFLFKKKITEIALEVNHSTASQCVLGSQSCCVWFYFQHCKRSPCFVLSSPCCGWLAFRGWVLLGERTCLKQHVENTRTTFRAARCPRCERTGSQHRLRGQKLPGSSFTILTEHLLSSGHHCTCCGKPSTENKVPAITELMF